MEAISLVMEIAAFFTSAESSEVFSSLWNGVGEKLEYNTTTFEAILTIFADCNIKIGLRVLRIEIGKFVEVLDLLRRVLIVVNTFAKEGSEASLCFLVLGSLLFLDSLMLGTQRLVCGVKLNCSHNVSQCLVVLVDFGMSNRFQIVGFLGICVDSDSLTAVDDSLAPILSVVGAD